MINTKNIPLFYNIYVYECVCVWLGYVRSVGLIPFMAYQHLMAI